MTFKIEHIFTADDIAAVNLTAVSLIDLQHFPTPWNSLAWNELFLGSTRMLSLAFYGDVIVGFALFDYSIVDSFAHLLKIVILPNFRKKGEGTLLLSSSLEVLTAGKKINQFFLEVETTNLDAINLYQKARFIIIHTKKDFYGTNRDAFVMTLNQ